ncbi:MAG: hypothetical protein JJU28_03620 [Cyclobacteriaceae bacterium]|nr:hypothetical protein [Cyclobacteriaceae bacterium]
MVRQIFIPNQTTLILEIPESFVGKRIELLAFEVEEDSSIIYKNIDKSEKLNRLNESLEGYKVDLSNYTFDRNQANDYE